AVYGRGSHAVFAKYFLLPENGSVLRIEAERFEGEIGFYRHRSSQIDAALHDNRRRPAEAGNVLLPGFVFVLAPFERQVFGSGAAFPRGTTELRPILGAGDGWYKHEEANEGDLKVSNHRWILSASGGGLRALLARRASECGARWRFGLVVKLY